MRSVTRALAILASAVLLGCTTVQVSQDYDPEARFGQIDAWRWREAEQPAAGDLRVSNPLLDQRIRRAIAHHLEGRHIRLERTAPDLLVSYRLAIQQRIQSDTFSTTMGVGSYYYPWYGGVGTETRIYQYDESQLIIDLHDAGTGGLIWRGTGIYRYKTHATPEAAAKEMQETVDKILGQFPPTQKN